MCLDKEDTFVSAVVETLINRSEMRQITLVLEILGTIRTLDTTTKDHLAIANAKQLEYLKLLVRELDSIGWGNPPKLAYCRSCEMLCEIMYSEDICQTCFLKNNPTEHGD